MIASLLIILFSTILFMYWFRYTCLLVLQTQLSEDMVARVVSANSLNFRDVQSRLGSEDGAPLQGLDVLLENDYRILTFLQTHAAEVGGNTIEERMLKIDYCVMRVWYRLTRNTSTRFAKLALTEMTGILGYFANSMGEHLASQTNAS